MWRIKLYDKDLYFPSDELCSVSISELDLSVGESGILNLMVPQINEVYGQLSERKEITVFRNEKEYWHGDIREISLDFAKNKKLYCLEDMAWLGEVDMYAHTFNGTYQQYFKYLLDYYNSKVDNFKKFEIGQIGKSGTKTFKHATMSILEILRNIADDFYVRIRRDNGKRYVDIVSLENYGRTSSQPIMLGENLMDFLKENNTSWLLTAILPLGAELETETIEGIPDRVNISSVNGGSNVLVNTTAVAKYGYIEKIVQFDTKEPSTLKNLADNYLRQNAEPRITMDIKAVDLSAIENYDTYFLGDKIPVICEPFGINQNVPLCKLKLDILNPSGNQMELSSAVARRSFTDIQNNIQAEIEKIPSRSELLNAAFQNALNMLLDETTGGYIVDVYELDAKGNPLYKKETNICDARTIEESTKRWVFNLNGIGYMHRKTKNDKWTDLEVAINMNGQIMANFITSGTMLAERIRGGVFEIGGKDLAKEGSLVVNDEKGNTLITLDKGGITLSNGQKIKYSDISGTPTIPKNLSDLGGTLLTTQITESFITSQMIAANAITATEIASSAVTAGKISVDSLAAIKAILGNVTVGGRENGDGSLSVKDSSNNEKVKLDNEGITASKGYIGTKSEGWQINDKYIRSKDGPTAPTGQNTSGTYVGTDGICNANGSQHVWITGGALSTNGLIYAADINSTGSITAHNYYTVEDGRTYQGQDTQNFSVMGYVDGEYKAIGLQFIDGLLVGKSGV